MEKFITLSVCQQDNGLIKLLSEIKTVENHSVQLKPFHISSKITEDYMTDVFIISQQLLKAVSLDEIKEKPIIIVQETPGEKEKKNGNIFTVCQDRCSIESILKAIIRGLQNVKVKLEGGNVIRLTFKLPESKIELIKDNRVEAKESLSYRGALVLRELFNKPEEVVGFKNFINLGIKEESLPVYISTLRKILKKIAPELEIKSFRSKGYALTTAYRQ